MDLERLKGQGEGKRNLFKRGREKRDDTEKSGKKDTVMQQGFSYFRARLAVRRWGGGEARGENSHMPPGRQASIEGERVQKHVVVVGTPQGLGRKKVKVEREKGEGAAQTGSKGYLLVVSLVWRGRCTKRKAPETFATLTGELEKRSGG